MFYENDTSEALKRTEQSKYKGAYHIHEGLLYHYTKSDTLWKILESDSLLARNIRFSNDFNEYMTGRNKIEEFVNCRMRKDDSKRDEILRKIQDNPMMYFMVCFCEEGDLLSQWRGYAQNGVSIGMDFTGGICEERNLQQHVECFSVLNNKKYQEALPDTIRKNTAKKKYYINGEPLIFLQMPYKVRYVSKEGNRDEDKAADSILESLYNNGEAEDNTRLLGYIPYIKDFGFWEEAEYRLVYDMEFLGESKVHSDDIRSKKLEFLEQENLKKPYINVEFGKPDNKCAEVETIWLGKGVYDLAGQLKADSTKLNIKFIDGPGICIGEGKNQDKIQHTIEKYIEGFATIKNKEGIKIWCKGHLPIRKIIVGPGKNQEEIKESLEYYKRTVYWLKYVDIDVSVIPLRIQDNEGSR